MPDKATMFLRGTRGCFGVSALAIFAALTGNGVTVPLAIRAVAFAAGIAVFMLIYAEQAKRRPGFTVGVVGFAGLALWRGGGIMARIS